MRKPNFMTPDHADAFVDFPKMEKPTWAPHYVECPKCKGHGGWNLSLNAYKLWDKPSTPENRHRHAHFRASCSQCWGYGWLTPTETECMHEYVRTRNVGRCLNEHRCTKCPKTITIDSSD
jgi:hypothetical protein